jgi:hypothetical protein
MPNEYLLGRISPYIDDLPNSTINGHTDEEIGKAATAIQGMIGEVIASVINAGSERDAINEDEDLHAYLVKLCTEWMHVPFENLSEPPDDQAHHNH